MSETTEPQGDLLGSADNQTETTPTTWYKDDYKDVITKKGWKDPNDVVKSYTELEKAMGSRVKMPSPESSADEIRAFYQKTGCPENPEGYEIDKVIPEGMPRDTGIESELRKIAYETGVSKQAFESIVKTYYDKINADMEQSRQHGEVLLKQEFGDKFNEVVTIANKFFDSCSPEFCELVKQSGLANNPVFIKEFMNKGKQTMSDTIIKGGQQSDTKAFVPKYPDSPLMYSSGDDEESVKAREYFKAKGYKY